MHAYSLLPPSSPPPGAGAAAAAGGEPEAGGVASLAWHLARNLAAGTAARLCVPRPIKLPLPSLARMRKSAPRLLDATTCAKDATGRQA